MPSRAMQPAAEPKNDAERSRRALMLWRRSCSRRWHPGRPLPRPCAACWTRSAASRRTMPGQRCGSCRTPGTWTAARGLRSWRWCAAPTTAEPLAVHRTYLTADGCAKAGDPPRASMGPVKGGAILLHAPDPERGLAVAEGIETAASASALLGLPAWACVSAGGLAALRAAAGLGGADGRGGRGRTRPARGLDVRAATARGRAAGAGRDT